MLTSDNKQWLALDRDGIMSVAIDWSKRMSIRKLESLIDWYRNIQMKISSRLNTAEKMGATTENTQEINAVHNMEVTALVARYMIAYPQEQIPEWLFN